MEALFDDGFFKVEFDARHSDFRVEVNGMIPVCTWLTKEDASNVVKALKAKLKALKKEEKAKQREWEE